MNSKMCGENVKLARTRTAQNCLEKTTHKKSNSNQCFFSLNEQYSSPADQWGGDQQLMHYCYERLREIFNTHTEVSRQPTSCFCHQNTHSRDQILSNFRF